jgi:hypothetical protein
MNRSDRFQAPLVGVLHRSAPRQEARAGEARRGASLARGESAEQDPYSVLRSPDVA